MKIVKAVVITAVVVVVSLLPPLIHFITGPISPAIGGYVAGSKLRLTGREALTLGILLALLAGVPAYFGLQNFTSIGGSSAIVLAILASLYAGGLTAVAAWYASSSQEDEETKGSGFTLASDD